MLLCDMNCKNLKCIATGECIDQKPLPFVEDAPLLTSYEAQGSGYDAGAHSYELQGRAAIPAHRTVIAFTGLAGSGKSTAALHLEKHHGFARLRFAGPLKAMLAALGCTHEEIDGSRKEVPCDLLGGKTPRHAMQTLGTEWGRELIANDLWIRAWKASVDRLPTGVPVVVDDCRFPNEAEVIKAAGGLIVHVNRPGAGLAAAGHVSEQHVLPADMTIDNVFSLEEFTTQVSSLARDLSWADMRYSV